MLFLSSPHQSQRLLPLLQARFRSFSSAAEIWAFTITSSGKGVACVERVRIPLVLVDRHSRDDGLNAPYQVRGRWGPRCRKLRCLLPSQSGLALVTRSRPKILRRSALSSFRHPFPGYARLHFRPGPLLGTHILEQSYNHCNRAPSETYTPSTSSLLSSFQLAQLQLSHICFLLISFTSAPMSLHLMRYPIPKFEPFFAADVPMDGLGLQIAWDCNCRC